MHTYVVYYYRNNMATSNKIMAGYRLQFFCLFVGFFTWRAHLPLSSTSSNDYFQSYVCVFTRRLLLLFLKCCCFINWNSFLLRVMAACSRVTAAAEQQKRLNDCSYCHADRWERTNKRKNKTIIIFFDLFFLFLITKVGTWLFGWGLLNCFCDDTT